MTRGRPADGIGEQRAARMRARLQKLIDLVCSERDITLKRLAREVGRDSTKLVPASGNPKLDVVIRLAAALGWPVGQVADYIWTGIEDREQRAAALYLFHLPRTIRADCYGCGKRDIAGVLATAPGLDRVIEIEPGRLGMFCQDCFYQQLADDGDANRKDTLNGHDKDNTDSQERLYEEGDITTLCARPRHEHGREGRHGADRQGR